MSDLISRYGEAVRRSLAFDRRTGYRLAAEAEDHLHQALSEDRRGHTDAAARRAIGRFGPPAEFAANFTAQIFPGRVQAAWRSALVIALLAASTMWLRRVLELVPWIEAQPGMRALLRADAVSFRIAIAAGTLAWLTYMFDKSTRRLMLAMLALTATAGALGVSIMTSLVVAFSAVIATGWSTTSLIAMAAAIPGCVLMMLFAAKMRHLQGYAALLSRK